MSLQWVPAWVPAWVQVCCQALNKDSTILTLANNNKALVAGTIPTVNQVLAVEVIPMRNSNRDLAILTLSSNKAIILMLSSNRDMAGILTARNRDLGVGTTTTFKGTAVVRNKALVGHSSRDFTPASMGSKASLKASMANNKDSMGSNHHLNTAVQTILGAILTPSSNRNAAVVAADVSMDSKGVGSSTLGDGPSAELRSRKRRLISNHATPAEFLWKKRRKVPGASTEVRAEEAVVVHVA